jgi:SH3 domain protein
VISRGCLDTPVMRIWNPLRTTGITLVVLCVLGFAPETTHAEDAWVSGKVTLNLRRGPGTQYKILGKISAEAHVDILNSREGWREVQPDEGRSGWIPSGYLVDTPPASIQLANAIATLATTKEALEQAQIEADRVTGALRTRTQELEGKNLELGIRDTDQVAKIDRLQAERDQLRADVRWREWLTGAGILLFGMALGAVLRGNGRKKNSRVRL